MIEIIFNLDIVDFQFKLSRHHEKCIPYRISVFIYQMNATAQESKKEAKERKKEEQYQDILKLIDTQQYAFRGSKANPQK